MAGSSEFAFKRIADPVYGTVGLSELETSIIDTRAFQRLHNIRQLGLAHYVFPGADYSRFSHSLGVCHVAGRTLSALKEAGAAAVDDRSIRLYRLAALLHDIGHYPFSHAMEDAIANAYTETILAPPNAADGGSPNQRQFYNHENMGEQVLKHDTDLNALLARCGFDPNEVVAIFGRSDPAVRLANLISSDLDADRIDYLLRTARSTGLPYGAIDLDYLLGQLTLDSDGRVCLHERALKTADHFLLCRYFDYQQVSYHKTVAGLELFLKDALALLIDAEQFDGTADAMTKMVKAGKWAEFDEGYVINKMRELLRKLKRPLTAPEIAKVNAILNRRPPKLVADIEYIGSRSEDERKSFLQHRQIMTERIAGWADRFGVDRSLWKIWDKAGLPLTKVGPHISQSDHYDPSSDSAGQKDAFEQAIRIVAKDGKSKLITAVKHSLMSVLSNNALYALRLYVLFPPGTAEQRPAIEAAIQADLPHMPWK